MPQRITPRALMEGSVAVTLTTLLGIAGVYFPLIGPLFLLIWPLPIIIITSRHGLKTGFLSLLIISAFTIIFLGPQQGVEIIFATSVTALILGLGIRKKIKFALNVGLGTGVTILSFLGIASFYFLVMHFNPLKDAFLMMGKVTKEMIKSYSASGMEKEKVDQLKFVLEYSVATAKMLTPGFLINLSLLIVYTNLCLAHRILKNLGEDVVERLPFIKWRFPGVFSWLLLMGCFVGFYGMTYNYDVLKIVGFNIAFIFSFFFWFQGLAVIFYFLSPYGIPTFFKVIIALMLWVITGLMAVPPINFSLLHFIGLFDCWFDYRRLKRKEEIE